MMKIQLRQIKTQIILYSTVLIQNGDFYLYYCRGKELDVVDRFRDMYGTYLLINAIFSSKQ